MFVLSEKFSIVILAREIVRLFISYLKKLCLIFYLRMFSSLVTLVFFQLYSLTMSSTHRFSTVFVNHTFFTHSKRTNRHLGARLSRIEKATNLKHQEIGKQLEWNSLLQNYRRMFRKRELEINFSCSQNYMQQSKIN